MHCKSNLQGQTACRRFWSVVVSICFNPLAAFLSFFGQILGGETANIFGIFTRIPAKIHDPVWLGHIFQMGWVETQPPTLGRFVFHTWKPLPLRWSSSARRGGFDAEKICDNLERLGRLGCTKFGTPKTPVNAADDRPTPMKWMKPIGFQDSIWWDM